MEVDDLLHNDHMDPLAPLDPCQPILQHQQPHCSSVQQSECILNHAIKRGRLQYLYAPQNGHVASYKSPSHIPASLIAQYEYERSNKGPSMFPPQGMSYDQEVVDIRWTGHLDGTAYALLRHSDQVHRLVPFLWAQAHFPELMRRHLQHQEQHQHRNIKPIVHRQWNHVNPSIRRPQRAPHLPNVVRPNPQFVQQSSNNFHFHPNPELRLNEDVQVNQVERPLNLPLPNLNHGLNVNQALPNVNQGNLNLPFNANNNIMNSLPPNLQPASFLDVQNPLNHFIDRATPFPIFDSVATTLGQVMTNVQKSASNVVISEDPYQEKPEPSGDDDEIPPDPFNIATGLETPFNQHLCSVNTTTVLRRQNRKLTHDVAMDSGETTSGHVAKRRRM
ncbi:unnamed protein product [Bursaphelenchus okinawaensis]|uniref:Uncharacterized protein n=1 Tax=Bursaphelenchus okinawaensis TaxID=465554 RepID=A0A811KJZ8_9BILA|nr:unnamed protein product [Bursaphelenchus okinawaensis]CAG9105268.1 unnamed protein product [Bursaphelenchus okinawaensis]